MSGTSGATMAGSTGGGRSRRLATAIAVAFVAALGAGAIGGPATADYIPYVLVNGALSLPDDPLPVEPGQHLTATNDPDGECLQDGEETTPYWAIGELFDDYEYGDPIELSSILMTGETTTVDGNWTIEVDLPADIPDGLYGFAVSCIGTPAPQPGPTPPSQQPLYDYVPSFFRVGPEQITTIPTTSPTTTTTPTPRDPTMPSPPPPAAALPGRADYTG